MSTPADIISGFGADAIEQTGPIDFSRATRIDSTGTTCDAYITRLHNKTVFVKRLKDHLLSAPRERVAFAKEFEIGYRLSHPALPVYRDYHHHYIVMDYVDGDTLAKMIADKDVWLCDAEHIRSILSELIDVVGYLHRCNVLHSDIKPDNVMITRGTRNTMLVDLDKAFTPTHSDTSGAPDNYGLSASDQGNPAIDFRGIAGIIDHLTEAGFPTRPFRRLRRLCAAPHTTSEELRHALQPRRIRTYAIVIAALLIIGAVIASVALSRHDNFTDVADTRADSTVVTSDADDHIAVPRRDSVDEKPKHTAPPTPSDENYVAIINRELRDYFNTQEATIERAEVLLASGATSDSELREAMSDIIGSVSIALQSAYAVYEARFPDIDAVSVQMAVAGSEAYQTLLRRQQAVSYQITAEIARRSPSPDTIYLP